MNGKQLKNNGVPLNLDNNMANEIINTLNTDKLFLDVKQIIDEGRRQGADAVSDVICVTNWRIGRRIILEEQHGDTRAIYGKGIINNLSEKLIAEYGCNKSFAPRDLRNYRQFYLTFNDFEIWYARVPNLNQGKPKSPHAGLIDCGFRGGLVV